LGSAISITARAEDVLHVTYHVFFLAEEGYQPGAIPPSKNGLADSIYNCVVIRTGIHSGVVAVAVEVRDARPERPDVDWDEVVEINLYAATGHVRLSALMSNVPDTYPLLTPYGPGYYRVRVHARGRDTDTDGVAFEPFEDYLVQTWPARPQPDLVYKGTDRYGAELRRIWRPQDSPSEEQQDPEAAAREAILRAHSLDDERTSE
jgi:hypothetical protein